MRVGDVVHYVSAATGKCCAALVRRVNADGTRDLVVFDSGPEEEFKERIQPIGSGSAFMLLGGPAVAARDAARRPFMDQPYDPVVGAHVDEIADRAFREGGAVTFPGGCFIFGRSGGYPPESGKWHWPEPQRGDLVWYTRDQGTYLAVVERVKPDGLVLTIPSLGPGPLSDPEPIPYAAKPTYRKRSWCFLQGDQER